jgi:hypothetical protein
MSKNTQLTNLFVNTQGDNVKTLFNSGFIDILDGTQPATGDTAITTQAVLVSLTFGSTAFGSTTAGVMTANSITSGTAGATGTASWFRCYKSDHTTALMDGSVGTSSANLILPTTTINSGQTVSCSSFTHTISKFTSGD